MFGKDTAHCDSSGYVSELLDHHVAKVALGKAHCIALNNRGQIFSFGLNNKGQCGHPKGKQTATAWAGNNAEADMKATKSNKGDLAGNMCDFDEHNIVQGQSRVVCPVCRENTRYNLSSASREKSANEVKSDEM